MALKEDSSKKTININLDKDLIADVDKLASSLGISRSALINMVMRGAVMGETSDAVGQLLGLAIEAQKGEKSGAKNGVLFPA